MGKESRASLLACFADLPGSRVVGTIMTAGSGHWRPARIRPEASAAALSPTSMILVASLDGVSFVHEVVDYFSGSLARLCCGG